MPRPRHMNASTFTPQTITADGRLLYHVRQLPDLPLPKHVVVRNGYASADGWFIRVCPICTPVWKWVHDQSRHWATSDEGNEGHLAQVLGIVDAPETMVREDRADHADGE